MVLARRDQQVKDYSEDKVSEGYRMMKHEFPFTFFPVQTDSSHSCLQHKTYHCVHPHTINIKWLILHKTCTYLHILAWICIHHNTT